MKKIIAILIISASPAFAGFSGGTDKNKVNLTTDQTVCGNKTFCSPQTIFNGKIGVSTTAIPSEALVVQGNAIITGGLTVNGSAITTSTGNFAAIALATATLRTDLTAEAAARLAADQAIGLTTGTLRTDLTAEAATRLAADQAIGLTTGTLRTDLNDFEAYGAAAFAAIAVDTTTLRDDLDSFEAGAAAALAAIAVDTATLRTDLTQEISDRQAADAAIGVDTATLRTDLTAEAATRLAADLAIGVDTATLRTDLTNLENGAAAQFTQVAVDTTTLAGSLAGKANLTGGNLLFGTQKIASGGRLYFETAGNLSEWMGIEQTSSNYGQITMYTPFGNNRIGNEYNNNRLSGLWGFGKDSPTEAIDVNGNIKASGNVTISGLYNGNGANLTNVVHAETDPLSLHTTGGALSGSVGINALDAFFGVGQGGNWQARLHADNTNGGDLRLQNAAAVTNTFLSGSQNSYLNANAGLVGIGKTVPTVKLDVNGGIIASSSITANGGFYGDGTNLSLGWERILNACGPATTCAATCSVGKKLVGGGCATGNSTTLNDAGPTADDTYTCNTSITVNLTATALCLKTP